MKIASEVSISASMENDGKGTQVRAICIQKRPQFRKIKTKKCSRMVVRARELTKELLNSLNDISSTCLRGENGLFPRSWVILGYF